ncbi:MAG: Stp1/IreP family PP2C-type Ser/Thr phosphatase [Lachnospiraceae bacterium]|nr:Stp1/IreP family PP2C-type Ser/Thr phosphatase [Lachnospiraceae bacterium]
MRTFSITDIGMIRKVNQDFLFSCENPIGPLPNLFLVADGMGGYQAGDYASRCCVDTMVSVVKESKLRSPIGIIESAIQAGNMAVFKDAEADASLYGMGTTIVATTIIGSELYVANVGDSRAYLIREGIHQITEDHSWVEDMIRSGNLARKDAKGHPNKNVITRAVGPAPVVQADFFELQVQEGDVILMCTDGLTNMVDDDQICSIVKNKADIALAGKELIRAANANGGRDNIGIVLIEV